MIRKFQRQDLEAAVKIWLAANKEAHDFIDPCYWEGYKDAVKEMFLQAEIYVFETEDMMEEIFDETGGILGFIGLDKDYVEGIFVRGDVRSQSIGKQLLDFVKQKAGHHHDDTLPLLVYFADWRRQSRPVRVLYRPALT